MQWQTNCNTLESKRSRIIPNTGPKVRHEARFRHVLTKIIATAGLERRNPVNRSKFFSHLTGNRGPDAPLKRPSISVAEEAGGLFASLCTEFNQTIEKDSAKQPQRIADHFAFPLFCFPPRLFGLFPFWLSLLMHAQFRSACV
ncbi:hypothetical protein [Pseudoduganella lurida]|uniref:hypothetical protein n=1 Tax=Pseudoduganella lurida TaxID=1036180 RepID=UPI0011A9A5E1|nr:hypothetical protein [Pseudoduganella lurida]